MTIFCFRFPGFFLLKKGTAKLADFLFPNTTVHNLSVDIQFSVPKNNAGTNVFLFEVERNP